MLRRLLQPRHGYLAPTDHDLALNFSFVLHERSDSNVVQSAVRASRRHAQLMHRRRPGLSSPTTTHGYDATDVNHWLTATLGLPHLLADALSTQPENIVAVDDEASTPQLINFFRAPAMLALPDADERRIGVAALILRPGGQTSHLAISGVHAWPSERDAVLRALERLIQAHAGQWHPKRSLWDAPSESLLAAEID